MIRDLTFAIRGLRRDGLYSLAVFLTFALTLGASTAVFSIVNGVLLRPLPYPEPARLVSVREIVPQWSHQYPTLPANLRHFEEWRSRATSFASMAALDWRTTNAMGAGEPFQAAILRASGTLFETLEIPVAAGRPLGRADEGPGSAPVAVISHQLWHERFGGERSVIGRTLTLGGLGYTIVGILPQRFAVPSFDVLGDAAILRSNFAAIVPFRVNLATIGVMGTHNYAVIGRLKSGATIEQARAELDVVQDAIATAARRETHEDVDLRGRIAPLDEAIVGRARLGLVLLLGAVLGVVLIACANVANLSLTRTLARLRDAAVRCALGASRARITRELIVEQLVLAVSGGAAGVLIARIALDVFVRTAPIDLPRAADVTIDGRVLAFAAVLSFVSGVAVALLPAWRIARGNLQPVLHGGGRGGTDRGGVHARGVLLGVQVALSVTLLAVTGLFAASFVRLLRVDPGFSPTRVVTMEIAPIAARYPDTKERARLYDRIWEGARRVPGVTAIAWTSALPLTGETWVDSMALLNDTGPNAQHPSANYRFVGPDYFRVLSIAIVRGRSLEERDRTSALTPAVISARAARTMWPAEDAVGKRFTRSNPEDRFEVVGVVADGHPTALDVESPLMVYVPYWFNNEGRSVLLAQMTGDPAATIRGLRAVVHAVDPDVAVGATAPLDDVVDRALAGRRYQTVLFVAFGAIALAIATVGVYATAAYGVSRRRREMNIRVALGAPVSRVFALVLRQSAVPLAVGVVAGCAAALGAGRVVGRLLFQVQPRDPIVMSAAAVLVGLTGLLAAAIATQRGLRIDPSAALRED